MAEYCYAVCADYPFMLNVANEPYMLSVVLVTQNDIMLSVVVVLFKIYFVNRYLTLLVILSFLL
jgi:hypothetical protein